MREICDFQLPQLSAGFARIRVEYSSLNFKDALCANGHPGVAKTLPIIPGIDASGTIVDCPDGTFQAGDKVMVFHANFGTETNGGWSELIDVPVDWVYPLPSPLTTRQSMILGTAGFTAAQCVEELQKHAITSSSGPVIVSGATGGVGICSVKLLSKLGYEVVAVTGKIDRTDWLKMMGAAEVLPRSACDDQSNQPLLKGRWAGAVDTVGGNTLATILRSTRPSGCVTACGLVGGVDLAMTVYPFILRGVTLQGIDTAVIKPEYRAAIWKRLASDFSIDGLDDLAIEVDLYGLEEKIAAIMDGQIAGRVILALTR